MHFRAICVGEENLSTSIEYENFKRLSATFSVYYFCTYSDTLYNYTELLFSFLLRSKAVESTKILLYVRISLFNGTIPMKYVVALVKGIRPF